MPVISVFDIFKVGIGPSSSHTGGPMLAAQRFTERLAGTSTDTVEVTLHGSLAFTGRGHGTDKAVQLGLSGYRPETVNPDDVDAILGNIATQHVLSLAGVGDITFNPERGIRYNYDEELPRHTNGMHFVARDAGGEVIAEDVYYSLGGGFIARGDEPETASQTGEPPYPFTSAESLLSMAKDASMDIADLQLANEQAWRDAEDVDQRMRAIWQAMSDCIERGLHTDGILPGRMAVARRACRLRESLESRSASPSPMDAMDWVNAFAIAVNEENAAGGRVVTSPTNGAAGIIPAVMMYYSRVVDGADWEGIRRFLLTAGAIGVLYKVNASISGAEMGCQGEVGVACSMAAAGLAAAMGAGNAQVEEAAEIGMEHNLGLTCDPIGGLVQIPCIERNAMS